MPGGELEKMQTAQRQQGQVPNDFHEAVGTVGLWDEQTTVVKHCGLRGLKRRRVVEWLRTVYGIVGQTKDSSVHA